MDYIGSKDKLNKWIFSNIKKYLEKDLIEYVFLDACAGSGSVSMYAISKCNFKKVITNDIMEFPSVIINGYIQLKENTVIAERHIANINKLEGVEGFFYSNYSENASRFYFTNENAKKIDATINYIKNVLDNNMRYYLLYCGIEALSKVSNTTGVQAAFLKQFKDRAKQPFFIKLEKTYIEKTCDVKTFSRDILSLLKDENFRLENNEDILYIDPPYNQRQYGPNYHLYETFCRNDNPEIKGKTGLRYWEDESKSLFCSKNTCCDFLTNVIKFSTAKIVAISYNSDGLLSADEIINLILRNFSTDCSLYVKNQKRYKSDNKRDNNISILKEYLFIFNKKQEGEDIFKNEQSIN
jgi:adenine-specific DNA-methyltransferase